VGAGMTAIGVTTGSASADELWRAGASQVTASLGDLALPEA
jgi:phosphoglycolate phosphatase-like HAD superfamily hydrolase